MMVMMVCVCLVFLVFSLVLRMKICVVIFSVSIEVIMIVRWNMRGIRELCMMKYYVCFDSVSVFFCCDIWGFRGCIGFLIGWLKFG